MGTTKAVVPAVENNLRVENTKKESFRTDGAKALLVIKRTFSLSRV